MKIMLFGLYHLCWSIGIAAVLWFGFVGSATASPFEKDFQGAWCTPDVGEKEYVLADRTRVDCLTDVHAIEFDWAKKWAESIGQSLHYARMTGQRAGIILIILNVEKDAKYVTRVRKAIDHFGLPIDLCTIDASYNINTGCKINK